MAINFKEGSYNSCDTKHTVVYSNWFDGDKKPKAILQLCHGMAEYIDRYDDFARFMASDGYIVYGNDHLGHGRSVSSNDELGYFAKKDGYRLLVEDVHLMTEIARKENPTLPLILLGHSMGSMVVRLYADSYSKDIDGLIIMGTSGKNPLGGVGIAIVNIIKLFKGENHRSKLIDNIGFGTYTKNYEDVQTPLDWLSKDRESVKRYIEDEKCGFLFTLAGYNDLFHLLGTISKKEWADGIRKDLPIFIVSGKEDPVGNYGRGVSEVRDVLRAKGIENVSMKLYDNLRHEILNEPEKQQVYDDILNWCNNLTK
ncbi:MAG: alpha/beta hydrolase [Oscillospiraceae bacterium]